MKFANAFAQAVLLLVLCSPLASAHPNSLSLQSLRLVPSSPAMGSETSGGGGAEDMLNAKTAPAPAADHTRVKIFGGIDCKDSLGRPISREDAAYAGCQRNVVETHPAAPANTIQGATGMLVPAIPVFSGN